MSEIQSFSFAEAARLGRALIAQIKPFCDNGAALWAGSLRRQQPQVKDREKNPCYQGPAQRHPEDDEDETGGPANYVIEAETAEIPF